MTGIRFLVSSFIAFFFLVLFYFFYPRFDMVISGYFYHRQYFSDIGLSTLMQYLRHSYYFIFTVSCCLVLIFYLIRKQQVAYGIAFFLLCVVFGNAVVTPAVKLVFKRPRPANVISFGGDKVFSPPGQITSECSHNCSFVSGEATFAFQLIVFGMVFRHKRTKSIVYTLAILYYSLISLMRIMLGRHFLSDVLFAACLMGFVDGVLYLCFYRIDNNPRFLVGKKNMVPGA